MMDMNMSLSISGFLEDYKAAKNKDEEAFVISRALEKLHGDQGTRIEENKKDLLTKQDFYEGMKDYVTKDDLKRELQHYATKDDLSRTKWQVIGVILSAFAFTIVIPLWLKHMGI